MDEPKSKQPTAFTSEHAGPYPQPGTEEETLYSEDAELNELEDAWLLEKQSVTGAAATSASVEVDPVD